jgi:hypothetical protein
MQNRFKVLALKVALVWALVPQLACFFPETVMTESEADCCRHMAGDCGQMNMPSSHECCKHVVRADFATIAKAPRHIVPDFESAVILANFETLSVQLIEDIRGFAVAGFETPPPGPPPSSLVLRI